MCKISQCLMLIGIFHIFGLYFANRTNQAAFLVSLWTFPYCRVHWELNGYVVLTYFNLNGFLIVASCLSHHRVSSCSPAFVFNTSYVYLCWIVMYQVSNYYPPPSINNSIKVSEKFYCMFLVSQLECTKWIAES